VLSTEHVTRVPSLVFLHAHLNYLQADPLSVYNCGIDCHKVFYVLDPDQNLPTTQETFENSFKGSVNFIKWS